MRKGARARRRKEAPGPAKPSKGAPQGKQAKEPQAKDKAKSGPGIAQPSGEREPGITPQQRRKATTANMALESSAFKGGAVLPASFTCDGADRSPPLRWSGVPADAAELIIFVLNMQPVDNALFFDWAVAGVDPSVNGVDEGKLPAGAVVGKNSFGKRGYSLCPPSSEPENYIVLVYAIPDAIRPGPGFDPLPLREKVVKQGGNVGLLSATYQRK